MNEKKALIVGAGLVGALQACYLQKRGYKVDIYESRGDFREVGYLGGRSINLALSRRGWSALEKIGLREEIEHIAIPMYGRTIHQIDGSIDFQPYGKENQAIYSVSRGELNKKMVELADKVPNVNFHFHHYCQEINFDTSTAEFIHTITKEKIEVNAPWIIGTDGAFSRVRNSMMKTPRFQYSQFYINHGYKELSIPATKNGGWIIDKNSLHIWPRGEFMLIALPNLDGSFTCTLFLPFEGEEAFDDLTNEKEVREYFEKYFPDAIELMPTLIEDFFKNPTSSLITIRCYPWHHKNAILSGDAAHAVVPFFGQGMNCGFEDVRILDELMDKYSDFESLISAYSDERKENADAIAQMALDNFIEMRDHVGDDEFLEKKEIEHLIMESSSYNYSSMYQYVSFTDDDYIKAYDMGKKQKEMLDELFKIENIKDKIETDEVKKIYSKYF